MRGTSLKANSLDRWYRVTTNHNGMKAGTRVAFFGDIASPHDCPPHIELQDVGWTFGVGNLEGAVLAETEAAPHSGKLATLYNSASVAAELKRWRMRVVSLANNHVYDVAPSVAATKEWLLANEILGCGAGDTAKESSEPVSLTCGGHKIYFLAFGWEPIQCRVATRRRGGVNPLVARHVLRSVRELRESSKDSLIVLLMHWNYELELYPQPAHRQLAFAAVDAGASAVVGHHPHRVQGIELYEGAPIVYSLGNWWLPHGDYFGYPVAYPEAAFTQLVFEWLPNTLAHRCHWYRYDPRSQTVKAEGSEEARSSLRVQSLTPFAGMSNDEYRSWFKQNRARRRGLPIYGKLDSQWGDRYRDAWIAARQYVIERAVAVRGKH